MKQRRYEHVLDVFLWGLDAISRPDCRLILAGLRYYEPEANAHTCLAELVRRRWIRREGRGANARFRVTPQGAEQRKPFDPVAQWDAAWDNQWRFFTYDIPEKRRGERIVLLRALRARKFGLLQRSVWVWPHPAEPILKEILKATGIPECFCGVVSHELFLCTDRELVGAAWNFEHIGEHHHAYLDDLPGMRNALRSAQDLKQLARAASSEQQAYERAFSADPLLPRPLWPKAYTGLTVQRQHVAFLSELRHRLQSVAGGHGD